MSTENVMKELFEGFVTGINYWDSENAINMWEKFDPLVVESDFKKLKSVEITYLRVFPLWPVFQPLCSLNSGYEYRMGEHQLPDTSAGRAGVSEQACEQFEYFCRLSEKYGFKLIVGLITGHMSFRNYIPPAFTGKNIITDPTVIKWQLRFVRYFVSRFKDTNAIVGWDLGNEINNFIGNDASDAFYLWCSTISSAIRTCDPSRPIITGFGSSNKIESDGCKLTEIAEYADWNTTHPYSIFYTDTDPVTSMKCILDLPFQCRLSDDISKRPTFIQEFGAIGYMNCSRRTEALYYRAAAHTALAHNCHSIMWWCAFDQGKLDYAPYDWNNIGSDYGFFDSDGNAKPVAAENIKFSKFLKSIGGTLPEYRTDAVVLIPRDENGKDTSKDTLRATYILAKRSNLDIKFSYVMDQIPDAPLYIFSSLCGMKSITRHRLAELLEKVRNGSVLYISLDTALFRMIPELTGVQFATRAVYKNSKTIMLSGEKLPIDANVEFSLESVHAEIISADEFGTPCFFCKDYGKGKIFFLMLPLEAYLAKREGAFYKENEPRYDLIYRKLANAAGIHRVADSSNHFVRLTEHPVNDHEVYVYAINYSMNPQSTEITLPAGATVTPIFGQISSKNVVELEPDCAALFLIRK